MRLRIWQKLLMTTLVGSFFVTARVDETLAQDSPPGKFLELPAVKTDAGSSPVDAAEIRDALAGKETRGTRDLSLVDQGPAKYFVAHIEFENPAAARNFDVAGTHVLTRVDQFVDAFVRADDDTEAAVKRSPGFKWLDYGSGYMLPPPLPLRPEEAESRQQPAPIVRGGIEGLSGKGVVVAILDTGVDFRHPDFITFDDQGRPVSRLLYFWDTDSDLHVFGDVGAPAPVTYPNGAPIGTIYSRDVLTQELRRKAPRIPVSDMNSHGTRCASVAAGNGNASNGENQGVAPEADIIAVRLGGYGTEDRAVGKTWLLGAICEWLDKAVGARPVVMSCSYGGHSGGHDGFGVDERQLTARFPLSRQGRAICIAAGNEGGAPIHAEADLGGSSEYLPISWQTDSWAVVDLYIQAASLDDLDRRYEGSAKIQPIEQPFIHRLTGQMVVRLYSEAGEGNLYLKSRSGQPIAVDAYIANGAFVGDSVSTQKLIGTPGSAHNAITVGSFNWNDELEHHGRKFVYPDVLSPGTLMTIGSISAYSSPGPLRFGNVPKPDIVAPGQWHQASLPLNVPAPVGRPYNAPEVVARDATGFYAPFNGTSAATPYTAGVIALVMEKKPNITLGQIKELLRTCATADNHTGGVPNAKWGYGKLDRAAVQKMLSKAN